MSKRRKQSNPIAAAQAPRVEIPDGRVAQVAEQTLYKGQVGGANPPSATTLAPMEFGNVMVKQTDASQSFIQGVGATITGLIGRNESPSILEQTQWPTGFYSFPDEGVDTEYFNCGIVEANGSDWLIVRRARRRYLIPWRNTLVAWRLVDNVPNRGRDIVIPPVFAKEEWEDPRAYVFNGRIYVSYCNFIQGRTFAHQCLARLDSGFRCSGRPLHIVYGKNGSAIHRNAGHEKNWVWFEHDGQLHFVYLMSPEHEVCRFDGMAVVETWKTENDKEWLFGDARGGTPPVRVGDEYFSFFHSSIPWRNQRRKYFMGAYAFEARPPFRITRMSVKPILAGSPDDPRKPNHSVVVFPCGSLYRNETWRVVFGVNDARCAWIDIPHHELLETMK